MTTTISPTSIVVELLRGDNYDDWSACMKSYMLAQDLWDFIEPSTGHREGDQEVDPKPVDRQEGDSKALRRKNAAALHAIQISCAPNILSKIRSITSAKVAWDTLANLHRQHSPSHEVQFVEAESSQSSQGSDIALDLLQLFPSLATALDKIWKLNAVTQLASSSTLVARLKIQEEFVVCGVLMEMEFASFLDNYMITGVATTLVGSGLWVWGGKSDEVRGVDGRAKGGALFCRLGLEDERKRGGMVMAGLVVCGGAVAWSGSCFSICRDS
ncbi:hypothetical protein POTOM_029124 [Populus tomentosa]|uniref:DUF4219 domain-containing protein n=1 Tax=Populus tomentosa TaxID=118781 RepID=A0A8X7ZER7_POPTO|nr:hypothetical protein POTOM_029124 [Populus tomentosa]